jgi:hypothetical protein
LTEIQVPVSLLQVLANTLGISSPVIGTIALAVGSIIILSATAWITGSTKIGLLLSTGIWIVGAFTGIIPLWVGLVAGFFTAAYFIFIGGVFNEQHNNVNIAVLIGVMIAIVVSVNLIGPITNSLANVTQNVTQNTTQAGASLISSLVSILLIIFVVVIILGAVAWMVGIGIDSEEKKERRAKVKAFFRNPREVILRVEKSSRNWSQYTNNLDNLLGIKTINDISAGSEYGLSLNEDREVYIHPAYDWYIADKYPDKDIFKIAGLHKENANLNRVYILGVNEEKKEPFLKEVPNSFLEESCIQCWDWIKRNKIM